MRFWKSNQNPIIKPNPLRTLLQFTHLSWASKPLSESPARPIRTLLHHYIVLGPSEISTASNGDATWYFAWYTVAISKSNLLWILQPYRRLQRILKSLNLPDTQSAQTLRKTKQMVTNPMNWFSPLKIRQKNCTISTVNLSGVTCLLATTNLDCQSCNWLWTWSMKNTKVGIFGTRTNNSYIQIILKQFYQRKPKITGNMGLFSRIRESGM